MWSGLARAVRARSQAEAEVVQLELGSSFKLVKRCGSQDWKSEGLAGQALVKDSERTGSWRFKHGLEVEEDGHRPRLARGLGME